MLGYSGELDGKAGKAVGDVGDVGCFLSVYAQCAAFFVNFMGWILNVHVPSSPSRVLLRCPSDDASPTRRQRDFVDPNVLDACPGYKATDVSASGTKVTATLILAGKPCNVFGNDIQELSLSVEYETGEFPL